MCMQAIPRYFLSFFLAKKFTLSQNESLELQKYKNWRGSCLE